MDALMDDAAMVYYMYPPPHIQLVQSQPTRNRIVKCYLSLVYYLFGNHDTPTDSKIPSTDELLSQLQFPTVADVTATGRYPPGKWGPSVWRFLHEVSIKIDTEEDSSVRRSMTMSLAVVVLHLDTFLACMRCVQDYQVTKRGLHFSIVVEQGNPSLGIYLLHNAVNATLRKPPLTAGDFQRKYGVRLVAR